MVATGEVISQFDFSYDAAGNIVEEKTRPEADPDITLEMTYLAANRLATVNEQRLQFDANGNMTKGLIAGEWVDLVFDSRNKLFNLLRMIYKKLRLLIFKLIKALLLIILAIVASFKYYEMRYFKPYIPYIEEMYNQANREESSTELVKEVIFCLEIPFYHENNPDAQIAGVLAIHFVEKFVEYKNISEWHFHNTLWTRLLIHHFDKEKLFILYLHLIAFERGYGLANSAQYYYQKTISQLTVEEVVMLLGIARSPTIYSPFSHPENAQKIQDRFMQKLTRCR